MDRKYFLESSRDELIYSFGIIMPKSENARKPCNVTPDTSLPEVTSGTGPDFCFRSRGF